MRTAPVTAPLACSAHQLLFKVLTRLWMQLPMGGVGAGPDTAAVGGVGGAGSARGAVHAAPKGSLERQLCRAAAWPHLRQCTAFGGHRRRTHAPQPSAARAAPCISGCRVYTCAHVRHRMRPLHLLHPHSIAAQTQGLRQSLVLPVTLRTAHAMMTGATWQSRSGCVEWCALRLRGRSCTATAGRCSPRMPSASSGHAMQLS